MKNALFLLLTLVPFIGHAQSFLCSSHRVGLLQIDLDQAGESRICQFVQDEFGKWNKGLSGYSTKTTRYFDKQNFNYRIGLEFITKKNQIRLSLPERVKEGDKANITWAHQTEFGPLINTGYADADSALCFERNDIAPCEVDRFVESTNMPADSKEAQRLRNCAEESERDFWGQAPTFSLVSADRSEFMVVTAINEKVMRKCSFGTLSSSTAAIVEEYVIPSLSKGWKVVDTYTNKAGRALLKKISRK